MEYPQFVSLVKKIASLLEFEVSSMGENWNNASIKNKEGKGIFIRQNYSDKAKIYFSSMYPSAIDNYTRYNTVQVEIGVSETKSPEQIVKDLERRFFPEYNKQFEEVIKWNKEHNEQIEKRYNLLVEAGKIVKTEPKFNDNGYKFPEGRINNYDRNFEITQYFGGDFKVTIDDVTIEELKQISSVLLNRKRR